MVLPFYKVTLEAKEEPQTGWEEAVLAHTAQL